MSPARTPPRVFFLTTLIAAIVASSAAAMSLTVGLPVWAMFVGWIAFYTRGLTSRSTFENLGCVGLGLAIGLLASLALPRVAAMTGPGLALPLVVLVVAFQVVSLRGLPAMNNLLAYFLGLVTWFAAHLEPTVASWLHLFVATAIGSAAGWIAHRLPARMARGDRPDRHRA
jgi:hypothetical protein